MDFSKQDLSAPSADERLRRQKADIFSVSERDRRWERCTVVEVRLAARTCDVFTERGRYISDLSWPEGGARAPRRGERYAVHFELGAPTLIVANTDSTSPESRTEVRVTAIPNMGGEDPIYGAGEAGGYSGDAPPDMLPGDWVKSSSSGNLLGVLEGGVTILKASELAQIIATQANHLLRLIGQNLSIYTGGGKLDFTTKDGKSSVVLRTGANDDETSAREENFTVRCDLGAEGEVVDFRVTDGAGRSLYRMHVDPDGRVQTKSLRKTEVIAEDRRTEIGDNDETYVGGDVVEEIAGSAAQTAGGSISTEAGGHLRLQAAQDAAVQALGNLFLSSGSQGFMNILGSPLSPGPAFTGRISNGDLLFDVGNPLAGDTQIKRSGIQLKTLTGDIRMTTTAGRVQASTLVPRSVNLGGPVPTLFSGVVYETLYAFMELFGTMIDLHTHISPFGGLPTSPPVVPAWQTSRALFQRARSSFVTFGG